MSQNQDYTVNYTISVNATPAAREVQNFADSVKKLSSFNYDTKPVLANINNLVNGIDKLFKNRLKGKKNPAYTLNINTKSTEKNLERVKTNLDGVSKSLSILQQNLNQTGTVANQFSKLQSLAPNKKLPGALDHKSAKSSADSILKTHNKVSASIKKVDHELKGIERGRQLNIKTDQAVQRLNQVLSLLRKIKASVGTTMGLRIAPEGLVAGKGGSLLAANRGAFIMSEKGNNKLQEKLYSNRMLNDQRLIQKRREQEQSNRIKAENDAAKHLQREQERLRRQQEALERKNLALQQRQQRETEKQQQRNAVNAVRGTMQQVRGNNVAYDNRRRAAINRLQYSKAPSIRSLPVIGGMMNAYMAYGFMKRELGEAVEYANIMESAHSILKVADNDLGTFEGRFVKMAQNVRNVGLDTKFTALQVAEAVKYLAMAGQDIETINQSIRPIANLALIGDNDISQIADLTTNIMAGYDIKSDSMGSVADIMASTISRSNVNIVELAESFKMASGYLEMAGVDFSEASAAVGILGNAGMKGTMAGSALRAMSTRFARPTKQSQAVLDRLGIRFTYMKEVEGKMVETLKPLADIFEELNAKNASMADMQLIFGKIGGNAAMMLLKNYEYLRTLTMENKTSHGISTDLALVKQNTTKGLWYQVTSQLSEGFMRGFEVLEPQIKGMLRGFLERFKAPEVAKGFAALGRTLLDILSVIARIGSWFVNNFHWIEPLLFTGIVATRLFKLAGALTNIGVAVGFIGKQSAAASSIGLISNLAGLGGVGRLGAAGASRLSIADKRSLVTAMQAAGISGKGAYTRALLQGGMGTGANLLASRATSGLFASQVATGNGLVGAGASIAAIGSGAVAATAGIAALVGALGWVAYKTWKIKEAKDAVQEDLNMNIKYRYKSLEDLYDALETTRQKAVDTKKAVDDIGNKTIGERSGESAFWFTGNFWRAFANNLARSEGARGLEYYSYSDVESDNIKSGLKTIAQQDGQERINAAWSTFAKFRTAEEVNAFIKNIPHRYGQDKSSLDPDLWTESRDGKKITYKDGLLDKEESVAAKTLDYFNHMNKEVVPKIVTGAEIYRNAITSYDSAKQMVAKTGLDYSLFEVAGFKLDKNNQWIREQAPKDFTKEQREERLAGKYKLEDELKKTVENLRTNLGGQGEAAANVLRAAGISESMFSNEPHSKDPSPFDANPITNNHLQDMDDGNAGGNYSGTGRLSSAAPKQVIVNISNLMSVATIDLMQSKEGQTAEVQNLKEQLAQALIDVVHDFDASWNG